MGPLMTSAPRRVTIVTPHTRADLALPTEATIAELIPQLISLVGVDIEDPTASSGGWVLSQLGADPYDPGRSVSGSGIRDGDTLYLSPRSAQMQPLIFDDVIDAIASAPEAQPGLWQPQSTRRAALGAMVAVSALGLISVLAAGPPWTIPVIAASCAAVIMISVGGALSRAMGDSGAGALTASVGMAYAAVAGQVALVGDGAATEVSQLSLLLGCVGLTLAATVSALVVGDHLPWFVAATLVGVVGAGASATAVVFDLQTPTVAAVLSGLLLLISPVFPSLALRTSRLPLPHVPVDVDEFRADERPTLDRDVFDQSARADHYLTVYLAVAVVGICGCVPGLLRAESRWTAILVLLFGLILPLRSRSLIGLSQRALPIVAGALILLTLAGTGALPQLPFLGFLLITVVVSGALLTYALIAPGRSPSPYVGRFFDIMEFIGIAAVIPVVAGVLDLYVWMRGLGG